MVTSVKWLSKGNLTLPASPNVNTTDLVIGLQQQQCTFRIEHLGTADDLLEALGRQPAARFDVTGMEEGKVSLTMN